MPQNASQKWALRSALYTQFLWNRPWISTIYFIWVRHRPLLCIRLTHGYIPHCNSNTLNQFIIKHVEVNTVELWLVELQILYFSVLLSLKVETFSKCFTLPPSFFWLLPSLPRMPTLNTHWLLHGDPATLHQPSDASLEKRKGLSMFSVSEPPALLSEKHETVYLPQNLTDVPPTVLLVGCCVKRVFTASVVNVCPL